VDTVTATRAQRADALECWADDVDADDLVEAKTAVLRTIAEVDGSGAHLDHPNSPTDPPCSGEVSRLFGPMGHRRVTGGEGRLVRRHLERLTSHPQSHRTTDVTHRQCRSHPGKAPGEMRRSATIDASSGLIERKRLNTRGNR
jgi:hypothetical protein